MDMTTKLRKKWHNQEFDKSYARVKIMLSQGCDVYCDDKKDEKATAFIKKFVDENIIVHQAMDVMGNQNKKFDVVRGFAERMKEKFQADVEMDEISGKVEIAVVEALRDDEYSWMGYFVNKGGSDEAFHEEVLLGNAKDLYSKDFLWALKMMDETVYDAMNEYQINVKLNYETHHFKEFDQSLKILDNLSQMFNEILINDDGQWNVFSHDIEEVLFDNEKEFKDIVKVYTKNKEEWFGKYFPSSIDHPSITEADYLRSIQVLNNLCSIDSRYIDDEFKSEMINDLNSLKEEKNYIFGSIDELSKTSLHEKIRKVEMQKQDDMNKEHRKHKENNKER